MIGPSVASLSPRPRVVALTLVVTLVSGLGCLVLTADAATHRRHRQHHRKPHAQAYSRKQGRVRVVGVKFGGRGGAGDPGDDYPAVLKNQRQDAVLDQWREYNRECTSFAAWALASRNGFTMPFHANARDWGAKALARGFTVDHNPTAGAIAWSTAGTYGHVAYVQDVAPGGVHIEEYNHDGRGHYSSRVVRAAAFTGYIHFKDRPADTPVTDPTPQPQPVPPPAPTATPSPAPVATATPAPAPPAPRTWGETAGGVAHTWTNYTNAGGTQGPSIAANQTVQISCRLQGFRVADGNTWWYRIASAPWSNQFYVSADAFYNNGQTSGSLQGTPFVDPAVAGC